MLQGRRSAQRSGPSACPWLCSFGVLVWCALAVVVLAAACSGTPPPEPEQGPFQAVAAGGEHVCGLQTGGTIVCWGNNSSGQVDAPAGEFRAVAAGGEHSCALQTGGTIVCWGNNSSGQVDAPAGEFRAVAAGGEHSCGLRTDRTVVCWGQNRWGQRDAPGGRFTRIAAGDRHSCAIRGTDHAAVCWGDDSDGQAEDLWGFTSVQAGESHSCGIRTDRTIRCWGDDRDGQSQAPSGEFRSVAAGGEHSCGVRADGAIQCWGDNAFGQSRDLSGSFTAVSVGERHSCGLSSVGFLTCWGDLGDDRSSAPEGQFSEISAGARHSCGVRSDSSIVCWGDDRDGRTGAPPGQFSAVAAGGFHSCGLDIGGAIVCWGNTRLGQLEAPEGRFKAVSAGHVFSCGLRSDQTIVCWGLNDYGESNPPRGRFVQISSGVGHSCAVRSDRTVACWGYDSEGQVQALRGEFSAVAAGAFHSCGLSLDKTMLCWGATHDWFDVPLGEFDSVALGMRHSCGVRTDGTISCWGDNAAGQSSAPNGRFSAVTAGEEHSCGLRVDGTVECWGIRWTPAPAGARHLVPSGWADPANCRPYGAPDRVTAGFPLPQSVLKATGKLRVAVLFVDFPDAAADYPVRREAEMGLPYMEEALRSSSYQRLDVEFVPLLRWLRAEHGFERYLKDFRGDRLLSRDIDAEAVRLADPYFDFDGIDSVMVVTPSAHLYGGTARGWVETDEGSVVQILRVNVAPHDVVGGPFRWGWVGTHEFLHLVGLVDMYPFDRVEPPAPPDDEAWIYGGFGFMSLGAHYLAPATGLPATGELYGADGSRLTEGIPGSTAAEMLAWSRWQLGWLDEDQVRCIREQHARVSLAPVAEPGSGTAMAAVPLSDHEVIVLESRRKTGLDRAFEESLPSGELIVRPGLLTEGVLVYTVDASISSGDMPIRLLDDTGDRLVSHYPVLAVGDSVTLRGYTITVTADNGSTHTVRIARTADS